MNAEILNPNFCNSTIENVDVENNIDEIQEHLKRQAVSLSFITLYVSKGLLFNIKYFEIKLNTEIISS